MSVSDATLYVVATPIGNLGDMVPRAIEVLQSVDWVAAEDTRHSSRLFSQFNISTQLVAYHDHSDVRDIDRLVQSLREGKSIALISDAGTPLISDPGYRLVRAAQDEGFTVVPIPGPCALIAAISASGLPSDRFAFLGFLPPKRGQRLNRLSQYVKDEATLIFYEAPHRIVESLEDMAEAFGVDRELVLAREMTKTFETIKRAPASELVEWVRADNNQQKGEMVVLVRGHQAPSDQALSDEAMRVMGLLADQLPVKQASQLAAEITGEKKKALYQWALDRKESSS